MYPKDTEKWKQFTTEIDADITKGMLFCIPKILKNESNSQLILFLLLLHFGCFVSQRYWKMKAIHNCGVPLYFFIEVVLYPKDTEKWKQFTTVAATETKNFALFCIPKILKNESNSQRSWWCSYRRFCCFVSQRYWKMKAIHNKVEFINISPSVVLYPKDTEKWKQFTTA